MLWGVQSLQDEKGSPLLLEMGQYHRHGRLNHCKFLSMKNDISGDTLTNLGILCPSLAQLVAI